MTFKEFLKFIDIQERKLANYYNDKEEDKEKIIYAGAVKIAEEFGEFCNEILASNSLQRKDKLNKHTKEKLAEEFADVIISTFIQAKLMDIDAKKALEDKIKKLKIKFKNY